MPRDEGLVLAFPAARRAALVQQTALAMEGAGTIAREVACLRRVIRALVAEMERVGLPEGAIEREAWGFYRAVATVLDRRAAQGRAS